MECSLLSIPRNYYISCMLRLLAIVFLLHGTVFGQAASEYAVLLTAEAGISPPSVTLKWPLGTATSYMVYRKLKSQNNFGPLLVLLPGTATTFLDTSVIPGVAYEYHVKKNSSVAAYGYISSGAGVDADSSGLAVRGRLLLLTDSSQAVALSSGISQLIEDLEGEGWTVVRKEISPTATVASVKQFITSEYLKDAANTKTVLLLGHIPVPYSGNLNPDAHPDHLGAWPCDGFYGEMSSTWTDASVSNGGATDPRNRNIPGDGKFDQSIFPSDVELQVGRIDLHDLPSFSETESKLLSNYLDKNHAYRTNQLSVSPRGLIDDNFGGFSGEAFAASAWKAFSTFFGADSIYDNVYTSASVDYRGYMNSAPYLWSYGCGGGSYTSAGGIGTTANFSGDSLQSVFTMLFGSYFGDWDKTDNFLRAPLAQGLTLTNAWSGRPHWYFHQMALGETAGFCTRLMMNTNPYYQHYAARYVHIALMGDPTLRMNPIIPPSALLLSEVSNAVELSWTASTDVIEGYAIYRRELPDGIYKKMGETSSTSFTDNSFTSKGDFRYSVRPYRLEVTKSGSYYNLGTGATGLITTQFTSAEVQETIPQIRLFPNPSDGIVNIETENFKGDLNINLTSVEGRILRCEVLRSASGNRMVFQTGNLPAGLYFIEFSSPEFRKTERLILK